MIFPFTILALFSVRVGTIYLVVYLVYHLSVSFTGMGKLYNYISNSKCYITSGTLGFAKVL